MVKNISQFVCQQCGYSQIGWAGKCPECGSWNSLVETAVSVVQSTKGKGGREKKTNLKTVSLASVSIKSTKRILTNISELDKVLGGGLVPGQVVLIAGEPGIGKSTLLTQLADNLGATLYVCGEESVTQVVIRARRLGINNKQVELVEETDIDSVCDLVNSKRNIFSAIYIDSIQTMTTSDLTGMAGSVGQVRECAYRLVKLAKSTGIPIFIVGHVTKEGAVAGPSVLMHIVDTVLWFEGDKLLPVRLLRAVKNRFGPTDEVGIFSMGDRGLVPENHPEKFFLSDVNKIIPGSVTSVVMNGSRPLLVEIQSLIIPTKMVIPRRVAQGIDSKKLELLLAVLARRAGVPIYDSDVFLTIMGGISLRNDPSIDLAVCLSLASSFFNKGVGKRTVAIGEVGLLGEVREVSLQEKRIKEAKRLGFNSIVSNKQINYLQEGIKKYIK